MANGPITTAGPVEQIEPTATEWVVKDRLLELTFADKRVSPPYLETKVRILVPRGFATAKRRYPTLLLLHGIGDTSASWTKNQDGWPRTLEQFTADKDVIIVMPDAGQNTTAGWYTDWYNGGAYGAPQWETYHLVQLLDYVDRRLPTVGTRAGRIVAGLSMGGYGAMSYASRHPDLFAGAFSFSGSLDLRTISTGFVDEWGPKPTDLVRHRAHNPPDMAGNLADTMVWFRIGMGVPGGPGDPQKETVTGLEGPLWTTNETFALALDDAGVAYTYERYPQGGHNWWHWHEGFEKAWPVMKALFDHPVPPPTTFHYKAMEDRFSIWGWTVAAKRDVAEFLTMDDVSSAGLTLTGSGTVLLTTPPAYAPGAAYWITTPSRRLVVTAGRDRRLRLEVTLGPSHTFQEDTAPQRALAVDPAYWQVARVGIARV